MGASILFPWEQEILSRLGPAYRRREDGVFIRRFPDCDGMVAVYEDWANTIREEPSLVIFAQREDEEHGRVKRQWFPHSAQDFRAYLRAAVRYARYVKRR